MADGVCSTDSNADIDSDTNGNSDTNGDSGTDSSTDSDTNGDSGTDSNADSNANADSTPCRSDRAFSGCRSGRLHFDHLWRGSHAH